MRRTGAIRAALKIIFRTEKSAAQIAITFYRQKSNSRNKMLQIQNFSYSASVFQ